MQQSVKNCIFSDYETEQVYCLSVPLSVNIKVKFNKYALTHKMQQSVKKWYVSQNILIEQLCCLNVS